MTEGEGAGPTAGGILRAARERQGLHIAALSAAIKVAPRKLDALEHDRYDELPDATFTRALAQTVCRALKIDPQPVLARLPAAEAVSLDEVARTLNTPFRDKSRSSVNQGVAAAAVRPMVLLALLLLVAAAALYLLPEGSLRWALNRLQAGAPAAVDVASAPAGAQPSVAAPAASVAAVVAASSTASDAALGPGVAASVPSVPAAPASGVAAGPAASGGAVEAALVAHAAIAPVPGASISTGAAVPAPAASAVAGPVRLTASGSSWVEARDAQGRVVFSRVVQAGETVGIDGAMPIRLVIGNAPATRVTLRGVPVDLAPSTRANVARLELR